MLLLFFVVFWGVAELVWSQLAGGPRSGQVRLFNMHSEQAAVAHACHGHRYLCPGQGKKGGGKRGTASTGGYKGVRAVQPESVAGGGWFEVLWNLECPVGLSLKKNMCAFQ